MLTCQYCELTDKRDSGAFDLDEHNIGFWCEDCDGFTYLNKEGSQHRFTLILEDKNAPKTTTAVPDVKLSKRLSPYRYPGGKSRVVDYLYSQLKQGKSKKLISPFTGGGSFELALLEAGVIEELHVNDLDTGVFSLWWVIKHMPEELIQRLRTITPTHKDYFFAQAQIKNDYKGLNAFEAAWSSLLVNRLAYSGVSKANPLGGRNGTQEALLSRLNPEGLIQRILKIHSMSDRITITQEKAVDLIEEAYWNDDATIFIDPPYVEKGKDLYHCYYTKDDHIQLAHLLDLLYFGMPGADIVVTYDYNEWLVKNLYEFPEMQVIGRKYSA